MPDTLDPVVRYDPHVTARLLFVAAAPAEARAVLRAFGRPEAAADQAWTPVELDERHTLLTTGIGKANAAGAVARWAHTPTLVLNVGIAGALPLRGAPVLPIGSVVGATRCVFADEGVATPDSFQTCAQIGFPIAPAPFDGNAATVDPGTADWLTPHVDRMAPIATVSTCSGTDALATAIAERTMAAAEGMEGAAVALAAVRLGVRFGEVRVISNTTGDRARQVWDVRGALDRLTSVIGRLRSSPRA